MVTDDNIFRNDVYLGHADVDTELAVRKIAPCLRYWGMQRIVMDIENIGVKAEAIVDNIENSWKVKGRS